MARRLELLGAELAVVRGRAAVATDESTHTRVRPGREPAPEVRPRSCPRPCPVPGRHAARGRLTLGAAQLAVVALLVLVALGGAPGGCWAAARPRWSRRRSRGRPVTSSACRRVPSPSGSPSGGGGSVTVDVAGKVRRPGIAVLDAGSRVVDALEAAGGARAGVDLTGLNLARVLVDGEQILVGLATPAGVAATVTGGTSPVADAGQPQHRRPGRPRVAARRRPGDRPVDPGLAVRARRASPRSTSSSTWTASARSPWPSSRPYVTL